MASVLLSTKFSLKTMKNTGQKGIKLQHKFITFLREKQEFSTGYYLIKTRYKKATNLWSSMERETMEAEVAAHALWGTAMAVPQTVEKPCLPPPFGHPPS